MGCFFFGLPFRSSELLSPEYGTGARRMPSRSVAKLNPRAEGKGLCARRWAGEVARAWRRAREADLGADQHFGAFVSGSVINIINREVGRAPAESEKNTSTETVSQRQSLDFGRGWRPGKKLGQNERVGWRSRWRRRWRRRARGKSTAREWSAEKAEGASMKMRFNRNLFILVFYSISVSATRARPF